MYLSTIKSILCFVPPFDSMKHSPLYHAHSISTHYHLIKTTIHTLFYSGNRFTGTLADGPWLPVVTTFSEKQQLLPLRELRVKRYCHIAALSQNGQAYKTITIDNTKKQSCHDGKGDKLIVPALGNTLLNRSLLLLVVF